MISEDLRRWFKEKWTAQDGSDCGNYKGRGRVKCRPSKRVSGKSPQTWSEMSPEQKKKAVKLKQKAHREGKQFSSHKSGKTWDGSKNKYKPGKKKMDESNQNDCGCDKNITEDQIRAGERAPEYTARLLRTIQSGDITSMDRHDRVHGALAYAEYLQSQYPGHAVNVVVRHFLKKGGESNATGLIVTGIDSKGKNLTGYPTGAGGTSTRHRQEVAAELKNITGLHRSRYAYMDPKHVTILDRLMDFKGLQEMYEQALNEENDETEKIRDRIAELRAMMRDRKGKHQAAIGGDPKYVSSDNHSGSYTPSGFDTPISTGKISVTTNHNTKDGTIRFSMRTKVPNPKHDPTDPNFTEESHTEVNLSNGTIYPDGSIDTHQKPARAHTADGSMDAQAVRFILRDHLDSPVRHPDTGKVISVGEHHGLKTQLKENKCGCDQNLTESKKPYKGFVKGKNHPEGGLSRKEAHRQGIHAGIETKDEAKRKGGFGKLSGKTQARRKSFCARMCGMKRRNTSAKTANDPKSKINAALRVWGCRCGTNESYQMETPMLTEGKNKPTNAKLWSRAKALARRKFDVYPSAYANGWASKWYKKHGGGWESKSTNEGYETKTSMLNRKISLNEACWKGYTAKGTKMKNGRQVPNCVPISENTMTPLQEAYARAKHAIKEEIVNKSNKGTMSGKERSKRDRIAKTVKGIKSIKGKPDSDKEAKYRYATYLVLRAREGKSSKSEKSNTKSSKKPSKKTKKR